MELSALRKVPFNGGPLLTKMWTIMKLTAAILLIGALHVSARGYSQRVNLSADAITLKQAFSRIEQQTGYSFFVRLDLLDKASLISVHLKDASITEALDECLRDQSLDYEIKDKIVYIKEKKVLPQPPGEIHGHVMDTAGNPLAGASVTVKGTRLVVSTDAKGDFILKGTETGAILLISYVGYNTVEFKPTGRESYRLNIVLRHNDNPLDEVQVIAYGTTTQRFAVGSISTVTSKEIEQQPVTNPLLALEGRVPGLVITPTSGAPGANVQLQIRGQNTLRQISTGLNQYDQPLFIVDGVPFAPQNNPINLYQDLASVTAVQGTSTVSGISPFNDINPADIESITVLKDADATSIYGSQGSNGVVIITTKKGKVGKTHLDINIKTGPNKVTRITKMLNTQQYLQVRREAFATDDLTPTALTAPDLLVFDTTKYTNWFKQFMGGTSNSTDVHLSLSGGSPTTNFILSGGYTKSVYDYPGNFADNRWTMHSGLHNNSSDHRFNLDLGMDLAYDANDAAGGPGIGLTLPPDLPDLQDASGNLIWNYKGVDLTNYQTLQYLKQINNLQSFNLNSFLKLSYRLATGLDISGNVGYSRMTTQEYAATPLTAIPQNSWQTSLAYFGANNAQTINMEPQINYSRRIGLGQLSVLAGGTYKKNITSTSSIVGDNYADDALLNSVGGAKSISAGNSSSYYKYVAGFGRIGYIYDQKYILSLTGRRDGSSNFGPGRQFGNYGSVGAGWIFSAENGFKNALPFISFGKLSANYGTSGSDGIAPYQYQPYWTVYTTSTFQGTRPYTPANLYNPDYSWDTKKALNLALNLGFLQDRLITSASYYRNRMGNELVSNSLPSQTGFGSVIENLDATLQNTGWELSITTKNISKKSFSWTTTFNISANKNKLIAFPGLASSSYANYYAIGKSTAIIMGYKYKGVNDTTGIFEYYKANGTPTYSPTYSSVARGGDLQPLADQTPVFTGGLGNTFTYNGFSLTLFFQFSKQMARDQLSAYYAAGVTAPGGMTNLATDLLGKYWQKPGDHAEMERLITGYGSTQSGAYAFTQSSGAFGNDAYLRLKTVSFAYNLQGKWIKKLHMQECSIYINAQNLLTFTNYQGLDPQLPGQLYAVPLQRTIAGGLSFHF